MGDQIKKMLEGLIGGTNSKAVRDTVTEAQQLLDKAGVQRKQEEGKTEGGSGESAADAVLTALESAGAEAPAKLVKNILDALEGAGALEGLDKTAGSREAVIALLLKAITKGDAAAEEAPVTPASETVGEAEMMKSLKDYIAAVTTDMGTIAKGQLEIAKAVKATSDGNDDLVKRLKALEDQLADRPRQASQDKATVQKGEIEKKGKEKLEASAGETDTFLGLKVKKSLG
jgi:hypothetical protein